ncbi:MAG: signal recognition particle-docking protein FtsY [Candidatus Woesearchaeota archaeon]
MFGFLKKGFQEIVKKFSKAAEKPEEKKEEIKPEAPKAFPQVEKPRIEAKKEPEEKKQEKIIAEEKPKPVEKKEEKIEKPEAEEKKQEKAAEAKADEKKEEKAAAEEKPAEKEEKKGFFQRFAEKFTTTTISGQKFDELFWELEVMLLENSVAVEVIDKLKKDLKEALVEKPLERGKVNKIISEKLKKSIEELFTVEKVDFVRMAKQKKPLIIMFAGINGSGKTTTIAKVVHMLKKNNLKSVIAASDTFRAAAIQQLQEHADKLGVKMVKHDYGADPAAVAFDAIKYAEANRIDVVLIDTAGRLHSNVNLVDELKKIVRVTKPDLKIFVGESITGNDCVEQAKKFNEAIGIDGIILAKADLDDRGGAAISISYVTKKPILFLGMGQGYDDLKPFDQKFIVDELGLEA